MSLLADIVAMNARITLSFADRLVQGLGADRFARLPRLGDHTVQTNHPAFVFGHLSVYPWRVFEMADLDSAAVRPPEGYEELFSMGSECRDDAGGTIYPPMDELLETFRRRYGTLAEQFAELPDEVYQRPNPNERWRGRFPTVLAAAEFLAGPHAMMHLGQLSAWRRVAGLGPAQMG